MHGGILLLYEHNLKQITAATGHSIISEKAEDVWRAIGFIDLTKEKKWYRVLRHIVLDFVVAVLSFWCQFLARVPGKVVRHRGEAYNQPGRSNTSITSRITHSICSSDWVFIVLLTTISIAYPGLLTVPYFVTVMGIFVRWAAYPAATLSVPALRSPYCILSRLTNSRCYLHLRYSRA